MSPFPRSAPQYLEHVLELDPQLTGELLGLRHVLARFLAVETIAGAADREPLLVEEAPDLADHQHVLALVVAPVAASLDGLEVGELLLPVAEHMRLYTAELAYLTDREVALAGDRRQFRVIAGFQHMPQLALSASVPDGM